MKPQKHVEEKTERSSDGNGELGHFLITEYLATSQRSEKCWTQALFFHGKSTDKLGREMRSACYGLADT